MKYPITPEYLASAPDPIVSLFTDLESEILADICRRFKLSGEATESAIAQIKILQEQGMDLKDIEKVIEKTLKLSERELEEIFDRAVKRNQAFYDELIQKADIVNADYKDIDEAVSAIQKQTHDEFVNLTQSLGFAMRSGGEVKFLPVAKTYQRALDDAVAQVMSGAFDYNTAIRNSVKRLSDSGLQMVDYSTGWHNRADVAARRAVMTGVSQLSAQYAEKSAEMLKTDYREVTAHSGARDKGEGWQNHKAWQGKVYSVRTDDKYPSIYEVCGWGMVDGLEGANCRHHHFPFVEGISERTYTDEQLENIDHPPFEYQGKTYTAYEATQKQRQIETAMRKCKREIIGFKAAGLEEDYQDSSIRLRRLSTEYKAFSEAAGLKEQTERSSIEGFGIKEAKVSMSAAKPVIDFDKKYMAQSEEELLPNYKEAKIADEKLTMYSLNKEHPVGKHKAIAFENYLGYTIDNKDQLISRVLQGLRRYKASERTITKYGKPFEVYMMLKGANGKYAKVKSGWIIDVGETKPRLTSIYVDE